MVFCRVRKDVIAWRTSPTWHDEPVKFALHWSRNGALETAGADWACSLADPLSICWRCSCQAASNVCAYFHLVPRASDSCSSVHAASSCVSNVSNTVCASFLRLFSGTQHQCPTSLPCFLLHDWPVTCTACPQGTPGHIPPCLRAALALHAAGMVQAARVVFGLCDILSHS